MVCSGGAGAAIETSRVLGGGGSVEGRVSLSGGGDGGC